MKNSEAKQDVTKLCLLYLLYTMNMQMSNSQLSDFAAETEFMDYFTLRDCLVEMVKTGLLEEAVMNNQTFYSITEDGEAVLRMFKKSKLSDEICQRINFYIGSNRKKIKEETDVAADSRYDAATGSFLVNCGIYEGNTTLMEIHISVVDKDLSEHICHKWKENSSEIYEKFLNELSGDFAVRAEKEA